MVGAMGTHPMSTNVVPREKWSLKSLFYSQFDSPTIEKKYNLNYLRKTYPPNHRLLVVILISHALINSLEIFSFKSISEKKNIIHLSILTISICLNILSLIIINRLKNRILSNIISIICLCPLTILSCLYPEECHIYLLIILIYSLANFSVLLSILMSISITVIITVLTLNSKICLVLLLITNIFGIYLNRLVDITMRSAYNQLCKNANVRGTLLSEHTLISKMIDSLMPRKYARVIMEDFDVFRERVQNVNISRQGEDELQMATFRPLHIERMENVSILFADIVGFTHMSSNKSASQLVSLLSDLYGRFDDLCVQMSCEKIATLGDCYYCVSGCPEPQEDHAKACVLMGLAMINAIEEFDQDNNEKVDMRVGVHSGSVNCGIVGTKKFKFDIFSNDVTLANKMESTGKPGYVHITEATHLLLKQDEFQFEEGLPYTSSNKVSIKTYFIGKRHLSHRITRKPPHMTLATAAAVAVASGVSLAVSLNETNDIPNQSEATPVTSPLLEEVAQARRATICEEELPQDLENLVNVENVNEKTFENEEKELVMAFNILTLKYKDDKLEKGFSAHFGSQSLLILEVILSILSLLFIYIYFPIKNFVSIIMGIIIGIKLILTLILIRFHRILLHWWILRHFIASFYLLSPLIIILTQISKYDDTTSPVFIVFISTYLILGASLSHLIKILIAILSISIYLPLIIFKSEMPKSSILDISICIFISLIVLYGITRQVEVARRSQYHVGHKSSEQQHEIEKERARADWLLRNILPEHVIEPLRLRGGSYSRNHPCVGVLFASLINFHVMYEEQYEGGKFYARILNEFYGDIEELFLNPRFSKIEKIKTIGATFMAASGLQADSNDQNSLESVCDLVDFALAFQSTMHRFNEALLNFAFEIRMGLNFGPVTAGVIGTTNLSYDIWGDTVNVASRMDSTGEQGRIQVPEHVALALEDKYKFDLRGEIDVKGKSRMTTYFLKAI
ncbi:unnamed protein product [Rotaria magnacalcarata]|uniref:Adenylate cyclase type 9 n=1 Tax=Rotaria magnacalcarata TaxID=392030 RepID=A0A816KKG8_9BILA|nr:unnamed protein product [Rotaria magnacalcarata]CAF1334640.1 unnamed protein product [Rotaria magnacalcarata]CAF1912982.1 unnamed protein product [Rotaria magnacalcarata]CAF1931477.1 unnamed protein product [Rotaria magnacalcarata]CAF3843380.1 unnamed protein product [Rotaria magnacalcarata]